MTDVNKNEDHRWQILVLLLKEVCRDRDITQEKLSELTGLKQASISRVFSLKFSPNLRTYMLIAGALNLNVFFEPQDSDSDLSKAFERAMSQLGRRPDNFKLN